MKYLKRILGHMRENKDCQRETVRRARFFLCVNISEYRPNISHHLYVEQMCCLKKMKKGTIFQS